MARSDGPIDLDARRGMGAQKATEIRRRLQEVRADQDSLRKRQKQLEKILRSAPAKTQYEVAVKARYLIQLFAATAEAREPRRQKLIRETLEELDSFFHLLDPAP